MLKTSLYQDLQTLHFIQLHKPIDEICFEKYFDKNPTTVFTHPSKSNCTLYPPPVPVCTSPQNEFGQSMHGYFLNVNLL